MLEALAIRRNTAIGLAVGATMAIAAYSIRVFELLGPFGGPREYPVLGPEGWFLLLAIVLAAATALGMTIVLTAARAYRLTKTV